MWGETLASRPTATPRRRVGSLRRGIIAVESARARAALHRRRGPRQPGPAAIAFVLQSEDGTVLASRGETIGIATNNVAEYSALVAGLRCALELGVAEVEVRSDSELMVKQMRGEYRVKNRALQDLFLDAGRLARQLPSRHLHPRAAGAQRARRPAPERRARRRLRSSPRWLRTRDAGSPPRARGAVLVAAARRPRVPRAGGAGDEADPGLSPNGDLSSTRSNAASAITATSVGRLQVAWRFRVRGKGGGFGLLSSTPLMRDGVAYVQDTSSSVYAIDLAHGRRLWAQRKQEPNDGPNGLALVGDRLYAAPATRRCSRSTPPTAASSGARCS